MEILLNILYLLYNAIRIIIICRLGSLFLKEERIAKIWRGLLIFLYIAINSTAYLITDDRNTTLIINFILYMVYTLAYNGSIFRRFFSFLTGYIINMICEGGIYYLILNFKLPDLQTFIIAYISIISVMFIIEGMMKTIFKHDEYDDIGLKYKIFLLFVPFGSLYLCKIILDTYSISIGIISAIIILFMINIAVFLILHLVIESYKKIHEQDIINREYKYYKNHLEMIEKNNDNFARTRHDYKNHSLTVKSYIQEGNYLEAEKYIDQLMESIGEPTKIVKSGNKIVDNLFNYKLSGLTDLKLDIDISIPDELFIPDYDMSILIGNLLDNSINALYDTDEKTLEVSMKYKLQALHIKIANSFSGEIIRKGKQFFTTKKDRINHGYGIKNIEEVVNKYGGQIDFTTDNKMFTVKILLCDTFDK